ncbi:MAG TPA: ABC transporter substrate-binding protein [Acidimicrobiia bacterium]|jgi:ABC-type branched-subunit amino acid transport system substrate-binding protein|nr:ABC transporter substrate-binding protein [Acidimicrobiia bacterium]
MKVRFGVMAIVVMLAASACSGGSSKGASGGNGLDSGTTVPSAQNEACKNATLTSPEVGVTDKKITVTVIADVENGFRPGLFKGSWDGVKGWADYINANGGLACRQVVVKEVDSHLNPDDSKSAIAQACTNSVATVGTTALFFSDVSGLESCKDKAGKATGLPDLALLQTEAAHQCSDVSFAVLPTNSSCPYGGTGVRTFGVIPTSYDYYFNKFGKDLHAVFVVPKDTPSTINAAMPVFRGMNHFGIKSDAEFGVSGTAAQTGYTQVAQAIKDHKSNYATNMLDYTGTVLERKEAAAQGVNDQVKVWDCYLNCYDQKLITAGGSAVDGQWAWLSFLPLEDKGSNPELDALVKYVKNPDSWAMQAWLAAEVFARAVNDTMKAHNNDPNSITRANLLDAVHNIHDFDANGMTPKTDIGGKSRGPCLVGMQVQGDKWVRVDPPQPGTFDCDGNKPLPTIKIDAAKEYRG